MRTIYDYWKVKHTVEAPPPTPKYEIGQTVYREHAPEQMGTVLSREFLIWHEHQRAQTCDQEDDCRCDFIGEWVYRIKYLRHEHETSYHESELCLARQGAEKYYVWLRMCYTPAVSIDKSTPLFPDQPLAEISAEYEAVHHCEAISQNDAMSKHYYDKWFGERKP